MSSKIKVGQITEVGKKLLFVEGELGSGAFGTVYKVYDNTQQETYALKEVICTNQGSLITAKREATTLFKANHARIVMILGVDYYPLSNNVASFLILTEYCSGGDLNTRLNESSTRETNLNWICQISEALSYLHSLNPPIVHRDLKADNVLLTDPHTENLKLGDFGLAREYLAMRNVDGSSESAHMYYMDSGTGPIFWIAPEFYNQHYTEKADVFSLGGIFYAILTRDFLKCGPKKMYGVFLTYPWPTGKVGLGYAMAEIDQNAKVSFPSCFKGTNSMMRLIKDMLSYDPKDRPSAVEVKDMVESKRRSVELGIVPSQPRGACC